jgi:hypothetical protein
MSQILTIQRLTEKISQLEQELQFIRQELVLQRDLVRNCRAAAAGASGVRSRLDSSGLGCTG